ncbi:MAG: hypothetical protein IJY00_04740 [Bacteroidaceae bacterium]|nr:hypothetical protein [Bacteroidaceae bacterium]
MRIPSVNLLICIISLTGTLTANAQKRPARQKTKSPAKEEQVSKIPELMQAYRFEDAIEIIQKELAAAKQARKPANVSETDLRTARIGADMLRGTEKVIFIDSIVVDRKRFLQNFLISPECGQIGLPKMLCPAIPTKTGAAGHMNELKDRIYYAAPDSAGLLKIHAIPSLGNAWGQPQLLDGMGAEDEEQDYPYMLADGVTLYYAAQGSESLGGYDIFVTRYNPETRKFVKAENIGMPFNSPANDFMYLIDETANIGWFATDRNQPADKVCIYKFIPNESREIYDITPANEENVRRAARIAAISESQTDPKAVKAALERSTGVRSASPADNSTAASLRIVINDGTVYTSLKQFRSGTARRIAEEWLKECDKRKRLANELDRMRQQYAGNKSEAVGRRIRQAEQEMNTLDRSIKTLAKNMRRAEMQ